MPAPKALILASQTSTDELSSIAGDGAPHTIPVGNRPLATIAFDALRAAGIEDVGIVVSPANEAPIRRALAGRQGARLTWIRTPEALGFTESLLVAEHFLDGSPFVVHRGDAILLDPLQPLVQKLMDGPAQALLLNPNEPGEGCRLRLVEGGGTPLPSPADLAGVHLFGPRAVEGAALAAQLTGEGGPIAVASALLQLGVSVETCRVEEAWNYDGSVDHLLEANRMVLDVIRRVRRPRDVGDVRIEGRVMLHPSAELERTTVRGPAVIGRGAVVTDAYIGPYSAIGDDVRVEGAEIEYSIIMAGATIRHPGRRVEASLVGEEATVSREFGLPSSLRLRVGRSTEVWLG